jgi:hypothetical protein
MANGPIHETGRFDSKDSDFLSTIPLASVAASADYRMQSAELKPMNQKAPSAL